MSMIDNLFSYDKKILNFKLFFFKAIYHFVEDKIGN